MKLLFPHIKDPSFIDFIYQEELLKAITERAKQNLSIESETNFVEFFLNYGKQNRITRPVKLTEMLGSLYWFTQVDYSVITESIVIWNTALEHAAFARAEYQSGIDDLELPVLRRFRVLDDQNKYHFLVARSKLTDLAGRQGADLFAYFGAPDDQLLYHGRTVDELKFNMVFGFASEYPWDKLKVGVFYFDEQLQSCKHGFFKSRLFSNIMPVPVEKVKEKKA